MPAAGAEASHRRSRQEQALPQKLRPSSEKLKHDREMFFQAWATPPLLFPVYLEQLGFTRNKLLRPAKKSYLCGASGVYKGGPRGYPPFSSPITMGPVFHMAPTRMPRYPCY